MALLSSSFSPVPAPAVNTNTTPITQKDLLAAMAERDTFDKLYIMITNRCIECYTTSSRKRSALKMHGSLAALDQCVPPLDNLV